MAGVKSLIVLAFAGCIGLTFLVLGCALAFPSSGFASGQWWPLFVLLFYFMSPWPMSIARRYTDDMAGSSACVEFALFLTSGIVISAFALPILLAAVNVGVSVLLLSLGRLRGVVLSGLMLEIAWGSAGFTLAANVVVFATILAYFWVHREDDDTGLFG